jgi:hypothetical protein
MSFYFYCFILRFSHFSDTFIFYHYSFADLRYFSLYFLFVLSFKYVGCSLVTALIVKLENTPFLPQNIYARKYIKAYMNLYASKIQVFLANVA